VIIDSARNPLKYVGFRAESAIIGARGHGCALLIQRGSATVVEPNSLDRSFDKLLDRDDRPRDATPREGATHPSAGSPAM
jgi:hypothetical protein